MKRYSEFLAAFFLFYMFSSLSLSAQSPEAMVYQAEARDSKGDIIKERTIEVRFAIKNALSGGNELWHDTYPVTTDKYGLFAVTLGDPTPGSSVFSDALIDWANQTYYLNVQVTDDKGNIIDMGTTQFLSVPYALHAGTASSALIDNVDDADASSLNELQNLILEDDILKLSLTNDEVSLGNYVSHWKLFGTDLLQFTGAVDIGDEYTSGAVLRVDGNITVGKRGENPGTYGIGGPDPVSGISLAGGTLGGGQIYLFGPEHISHPGEVRLRTGGYERILINPDGNVGIGTSNPNYKLDVSGDINLSGILYQDGAQLNVDDADADPLNELQDLSLTGNTLSLSNDATTVDLSGYLDNTDEQEISINDNTLFITGNHSQVDLSEYTSFWSNVPTLGIKYTDGNVGIGTDNPSSKLTVHVSSGGAASIGSSSNNVTGDLAIAMGRETAALGAFSTTMGHKTTAEGESSIAMGKETYAIGSHSTAMGWETRAEGESSVAMGYGTYTLGSYSTAMGSGTRAEGDISIAMGIYTTTKALGSTAMGYSTNANGVYSTAMGTNTFAEGEGSTAMGSFTHAMGDYSTAIGSGIIAEGDYSMGIGLDRGSEFNPRITQSRTMAIMGGNVGIGTTEPSEKLEVSGTIKATDFVGDGSFLTGILTTESDPTFTISEAANITATDISNLSNLSGINTGDQDLSVLALKSNVLELDNTTAFTPDADYEPATKKYVDDNSDAGSTTYSVGDFAHGGIVFWVDETGQRGLVCAKEDQDDGSGIQWYNGSYAYTQTKGDGMYAGEMNTMFIIANQGSELFRYAAGVCANLKEGGEAIAPYGDWYLPSVRELVIMRMNKTSVDATAIANGGTRIAQTSYWSSNEYDDEFAWTVNFSHVTQITNPFNKRGSFKVRAVRAF